MTVGHGDGFRWHSRHWSVNFNGVMASVNAALFSNRFVVPLKFIAEMLLSVTSSVSYLIIGVTLIAVPSFALDRQLPIHH
ncbi:hypothetical protein O9992_29535 [Vibrio lentus]|nr:hypothetical protein [Vibrio lentus]